ncbi:hypothetical protein GC169_12355 [bacterium]|nr:hypothetical protein [bacterium]
MALLGLVLAAGAFPETDAGARLYYDLALWPNDGSARIEARSDRLTVAVLGAVMVGWAMTISVIIREDRRIGATVWRGITIALLTWYVIDSTLSVALSAPFNAIANTAFILGWLVPVVASGVLRRAD